MHRHDNEYSIAEEVFHALSHGAGVLLSIAGLSWMLYVSIEAADPWRVAASIVYGLSLIALFLASTVYHAMHRSRHRPLFKLLDHCAIYLLIAGTYTPFLLVAMRTATGWWLFGAIWTLATLGILSKIWFRHRFPKVALAGYLVMGWLVVIAAPQVADAVGPVRDGVACRGWPQLHHRRFVLCIEAVKLRSRHLARVRTDWRYLSLSGRHMACFADTAGCRACELDRAAGDH